MYRFSSTVEYIHVDKAKIYFIFTDYGRIWETGYRNQFDG